MVFPPPSWIGTDESGKGDYFGPLVVAGVYADKETAAKLSALGVKDSKEIANDKIEALSQNVVQICQNAIAVVGVKPDGYNRLYAQFLAEKKNLNMLLAWGHARAIEDVLAKKPCTTIIADQFGDEKYLESKLMQNTRQQKPNLIQRPRAEENIAVAAASIVARARFLNWFEEAKKQWGVPLPRGASSLVIEAAKEFVKRHGKQALGEVAKLHFKTTAEVFPKVNRKTL